MHLPPSGSISRRDLLAGAVAGGATAALLALPGGRLLGSGTVSASTPFQPWRSPLHTRRGRSAHLLRRAGFGYTTAELDAAAALPYHVLVDQALSQTPRNPVYPTADSQCGRWNTGPIWLTHMATTDAQFPERMALFWHGLLTSGDDQCPFEFNYMVVQNQLFRDFGRGDLRTLLIKTALSAAMMEYLNLKDSVAGSPNENYAREQMELFTLGPGNYTETDVREAARSLTGYTISAFDGSGNPQPLPEWFAPQDAYVARIRSLIGQGWSWRGTLDPSRHDTGVKTFLGRTGAFGLEDIVDTILLQPACARFIARKAVDHFAGPTAAADSTFVDAVANAFRSSGYDITTMMRSIFMGGDPFASSAPTLNRFLQPDCYRSIIRTPVDAVVAGMRATGNMQTGSDAYWQCQTMGMALYQPPNVAGWHGGPTWVGADCWLMRMNVGGSLAWRNGQGGLNADPVASIGSQLDGTLSQATANVIARQSSNGERWNAILCSPEFQLK